jgi:putative tricarboxylic transport membrane protein
VTTERALNVFWVMLGLAASVHALQIGLVGPSGPESGLFPLLAGLIIAGSGVTLLARRASAAPAWPTDAALGRVIGVIVGLAVMAALIPHLGFAIASGITMVVLLRTIDRGSWLTTIALTLGSVLAVIWLFGHVLGMPLPRGPWDW